MRWTRWGKLGTMCGVLAAALAGGGCESSSDGGDIFVPDLSQNWKVQGEVPPNPYHTFLFIPGNDVAKVRAAAFTGTETVPPDALPFLGFFQDGSITFTYSDDAGAKAGFTYEGTIAADSMTITLMRAAEKLVLIKVN